MSKDFLNKKIDFTENTQSGRIKIPSPAEEDETYSETRQFQVDEFKEELAKDELELQLLNQENEKVETETQVEEVPIQNTEKIAPEHLTPEMRRQYWQEKQVNDDLEKRPFHRYPNYFYAGFWLRLFAYLVDLVVIQSIGRMAVNNMFTAFQLPKDTGSFSYYSLAHLGVYLLYFILITKLTNGQTVGKMIFGLRVVCFKEEKLSWGTVIIREGFCRYILSVNIAGFNLFQGLYLVLLFTPQKQHVGDLLSDTSVVSENLVKASKLEAA
ncbi:RDD family protein [Carnobacterium gallinarum]|uniref:RDD family protein n=1 Tax=Carnobacterium gallinarum TaxID=2749 RepID=UPI000A008953|nr:RDD family protein [Carnobacterium gallinarum]